MSCLGRVKPKFCAGDERGVVHEEGARVRVSAIDRVAGDGEHGSAAFADVFAVRPGNLQHIQSVLLAVENASDLLPLAGPA